MHHRIYSPQPLTPGSEIVVAGDEFHHAVRVARVRDEEPVEVFDGRGAAAAARVASIGKDELRLRIENAISSRESPIRFDLAMSIIALEKFEMVLQKATELGVRSIVPMTTERVEVRPERYRGKADRWNKIVFEAVKQCGRAVIPIVAAPSPFSEVVARDGVRVMFDADAEPSPLPPSPAALTLLVGPEGGWSDGELTLARERGCVFQRLGPRRLRAETAAIAGIATLAARLADI